jgi:hypothetical protein
VLGWWRASGRQGLHAGADRDRLVLSRGDDIVPLVGMSSSSAASRKSVPRPWRIGSGRFWEDQTGLEAPSAALDRGNERQAAANLLHDTVNDGKPETTACADR